MRRNLPPEAEQWGRTVDNSVQKLEQSVRSTSQDTLNALKGVNASVSAIAQQIERLNNVTETLSDHQAELFEQQTRLENQQEVLTLQQEALTLQQSTLQDTVSQVQALALNQVTGVTATNGTSVAVPISSGGTYVPAVVSVPSGYSRAVVSAVSTITASGSNPGLAARTDINGSLGTSVPIYSPGPGDILATGSVSHARTLTGLSGGSISAGLRVDSVTGVNQAYMINTMTVIFLK